MELETKERVQEDMKYADTAWDMSTVQKKHINRDRVQHMHTACHSPRLFHNHLITQAGAHEICWVKWFGRHSGCGCGSSSSVGWFVMIHWVGWLAVAVAVAVSRFR